VDSRTADYYLTVVIDFNLYFTFVWWAVTVWNSGKLETFMILKIAVVNFYHIFEQ
jgi:hypothetical protein